MFALWTKIKTFWYRFVTACRALWALYFLPQAQVDAFMKSYELFEQESMSADNSEESNIRGYYSVINYLCAIGEVEKMYIPPIIDGNQGVYANQLLYEKKMANDLGLNKDSKVLDIGCGRGRVTAHMASLTGCTACGINIDRVQLDRAEEFAASSEYLSKRLSYEHGNFNDPLPYPDESFTAAYQIQVLTYAKDLDAMCREIFRVLTPGGRVSFLDWVKLDKYDSMNEHHRRLIRRIKPLIGAVTTPSPRDFESSLKKAGFNVVLSADASVTGNGSQADLIEKAVFFYETFTTIINTLVYLRILPKHFKILFDRLTKDGDAFIEADRMGIFTTSYQLVAEKPL